jgi:hypothetical protein
MKSIVGTEIRQWPLVSLLIFVGVPTLLQLLSGQGNESCVVALAAHVSLMKRPNNRLFSVSKARDREEVRFEYAPDLKDFLMSVNEILESI